MRKNIVFIALLALIFSLLCACGQYGKLYLPEQVNNNKPTYEQ